MFQWWQVHPRISGVLLACTIAVLSNLLVIALSAPTRGDLPALLVFGGGFIQLPGGAITASLLFRKGQRTLAKSLLLTCLVFLTANLGSCGLLYWGASHING